MRVRSKNRKKGVRWAKGQSSSSNPEKTRHRDAARTRHLLGLGAGASSTQLDLGPSRLTAESLLKHDALLANAPTTLNRLAEQQEDEDGLSLHSGATKKTFETYATNFTNCDNVSFKKVTMRFDPNKPGHKDMLAVLAAVTDVIRERGGDESDTSYFAALLTALEETAKGGKAEELRPILSLIGMVIKKVSRALLQKKFSDLSKLFYDILTAQLSSSETEPYVAKCLIGCLSVLLRAQSYTTWVEPSTKRMYEGILALCIHPKPKIRRAAQHAVYAIMSDSFVVEAAMEQDGADGEFFHPVAKLTAEECLRKIQVGQEVNVTLHTLVLLKEVIQYAPSEQVERVCKSTWALMQDRSHPHTTTCGMRLLHALFSARPSQAVLGWELNGRLVNALYDLRPSVNDPAPSVQWLTVMQEALINLGRAAPTKVTLAHAVKFFGEAKLGWVSDRKEVVVATSAAMRAVLGECVAPIAEECADSERESLEKLFEHVEAGMGYQYHGAWGQVLIVISDMFAAAGPKCAGRLCEFLKVLADRRTGDNFPFTSQLDYAVGKAISWLLPVLKENVQRAELGFFIEYFLPLTDALRDAANRCMNRSNDVGKKMYQLLEHQVWSLLPSFCNAPTDLATAITTRVSGNMRFAQLLGETLKVRTDVVRSHVLAALRQLVNKAPHTGNPDDLKAIGRRAQNFLPLLCKIYATKPAGSEEANLRSAVYATLCDYAAVAPEKDIQEMFGAGLRNYESSDAFIREATMDILKAYLPYQNEANLKLMYAEAVRLVQSDDHTVQKKAYRILEELCRCDRDGCREFVRHLVALPPEDDLSIRKVFVSTLSKISGPSQAPRLSCLINIVGLLSTLEDEDGEYIKFVESLVGEAVLCIRAVNQKAKDNALELLKVIGHAMMTWNAQKKQEEDMEATEAHSEAVDDFVKMLCAGLGGDATGIRCSLLALACTAFEFGDLVPEATMERLLDNVSKLATCSTREVVSACLSFVNVFLQVTPVFKSGRKDIFEKLVGVVVNMNDDCKRHHRTKIQNLLSKLVRKFGFDLVSSLVPKDDEIMHKRLKNIHKEQARKQRNKEKRLNSREDDDDDEDDEFDFGGRKKSLKAKTMEEILRGDDSDSEFEDEEDEGKSRHQKGKKGSKKQTFIVEDGGQNEGIVDFLDPGAARQVTSQKPHKKAAEEKDPKKKLREKNGGFDVAADGRLIIKDDSDDDDEDVDEGGAGEDDSEGEDESLFKSLVASSSSRKRKRGTSVASGATGQTGKSWAGAASLKSGGERPMKYQAGGSGIHRPIHKRGEAAPSAPGSEYRSTKASGDVKRKGKPDPFAYVPLQKSSLNKRKRQKFEGQFNNIVKSAKKGAAAGAKNKSKKGGGVGAKMRKLSL